MPVLTRSQLRLSERQLTSGRSSTDSDLNMGEHLWFLSEEYDAAQKPLSFPGTPLGNAMAKKDSLTNLRINTFPKADLPDRYMSDEEEPSPSPDSETESAEASDVTEEEEDDELKHKTPAPKLIDDTDDFVIYEEYSAEVAVAVPITVMGPPKLIDITNLAPMQRRKRTINSPTLSRCAMKNATAMAARSPALSEAARSPALTAPARSAGENPHSVPQGSTSKASIPTKEEHLPKRQDSLPDLTRSAPDSWLPEDEPASTILEEDDDHYFPSLDVRPSPTYNDYDPYSLNPPSLSPRSSLRSTPMSPNFPKSPSTPHSSQARKVPGSIAHARKHSNPPNALMNNGGVGAGGWKGLTRTLSMAKRQEASHPQAKKPKMLPRGATDRGEMPVIPPFPFEDAKAQLGSPTKVQSLAHSSTTALSLKS